ncbi:MAG: hypothetical protein VX278_19775 [Myxococcota bacterium]|nr:hypothetical protein [Myxococcota bacterium]
MSNLEERGRVLEEIFFREQEEQVRKAKLAEAERQKNIEEIQTSTGIKDAAVIGAFLDHGVSAHTMIAIKIVPLVLIAWVDGKLDKTERETIMNQLHQLGIESDSDVMKLVQGWLGKRPDDSLKDAYFNFIQQYKQTCDAVEIAALKTEVLGGSEDVAQAAGGFLGIWAVSNEEEALLDELKALF